MHATAMHLLLAGLPNSAAWTCLHSRLVLCHRCNRGLEDLHSMLSVKLAVLTHAGRVANPLAVLTPAGRVANPFAVLTHAGRVANP